jgi:uncharacterized membrane protein YadS
MLSPSILKKDDGWAILLGLAILLGSLLAVLANASSMPAEDAIASPVKNLVAKPGGWSSNPWQAFAPEGKSSALPGILGVFMSSALPGILGVFILLSLLLAVAAQAMNAQGAAFLKAFPLVFLLGTVAIVMEGQSVVKHYGFSDVLWALLGGMLICNTIGTPKFLQPAVRTELYIKTGLVLLGAEVLFNKLLVLGVPGIFVAWIVTPVVLISTFWFGQKILKIPSASLNMVISADMSVCGVSAAIATAAACKAKKEELSVAIGLSMAFTAIMMVIMPLAIKALGMSEVLGGAWIGGTIDSTGAVGAAGALLGDNALTVATTIKMIQNILIGLIAFGVAVYWVNYQTPHEAGASVGIGEIWNRFPKFVLGFLAASILFSCA